MADEDLDADVQQHDSDPSTAQGENTLAGDPNAKSVADAAADVDAPVDEGASEEGSEGEPSPLEPGGKRFKQVYARAKTAEAQVRELREEKARLEGKLEATRVPPAAEETKPEPRLTWAQLEAGIDEGKITQAKALAYHVETKEQELEAKFDKKLREERTTRERTTTVTGELAQYKQAIPAILDRTTPERQKVEREFTYLVSLGYDAKDLRTELLACRKALGDIQQVKEKQLASTIQHGRETMKDIAANGKPKPDAKDPLKTITGEQRKYYQRMIDKGQYKGWAEVREELAFVPPR